MDAAWSVGSGNGGLDTGSIANTTYHVWAIMRTDTGVVDALFSTSATSPTMPTNYTKKVRLGSIMRVSGAILPFVQTGDFFMKNITPNSIGADYSGGARAKSLLSCSLPSGIRVRGIFLVSPSGGSGDASADINIYDGVNPSIGTQSGIYVSSSTKSTTDELHQFSNTSAQIYAEVVLSGAAGGSATIKTLGWIDSRGK